MSFVKKFFGGFNFPPAGGGTGRRPKLVLGLFKCYIVRQVTGLFIGPHNKVFKVNLLVGA